jgi:hypothetical protein
MKGDYKEQCNRTACSNNNAQHYNFSTTKYYCRECAEIINQMNGHAAFAIYGHDLCIKGKHVSTDIGVVKVGENQNIY